MKKEETREKDNEKLEDMPDIVCAPDFSDGCIDVDPDDEEDE